MSDPVYNFGAGPAMLPFPVMQQIKEELLNFNNMGVSVIEISHRSKEFEDVLSRCDELIRELSNLPDNYEILYIHGGAQMQFGAVPLNLLNLKPGHKAAYTETGNFSKLANREAQRFGNIQIVSSGEADQYAKIPAFSREMIDSDVSYAYLTSNNTIYGTQYAEYPDMQDIPLVIDATSDIFSRPLDFSRIGLIFAGLQKNLGVAGTSVVIVRKDLIGHALHYTPSLLDYLTYQKNHSMPNTINTFAIYTMSLILQWIKDQGGLSALATINAAKAKLIYDVIDSMDFYHGPTAKEDRSLMNVTFTLPNEELTSLFLKEALTNGLYALKGHRLVGGARASLYNPMPLEGCAKLADYMREFARLKG
jgi:phosphoserine aminotransferase